MIILKLKSNSFLTKPVPHFPLYFLYFIQIGTNRSNLLRKLKFCVFREIPDWCFTNILSVISNSVDIVFFTVAKGFCSLSWSRSYICIYL